jgi:hypothetical protein
MRACRLCLTALVVLLLVACQTSLVADLVTTSGVALFKDGFSDPASGWARTRAVSKTGVMDYDNGTYRMLVLASNYDLWSTPGQVFRDVRVEVDAIRLNGPDENRYGIICRFRDARNFYFFIVSSDGYYAIGKVSQGVRSLLGQSMMTYSAAIVRGAGPNHLRFDCVGPALTAFVNGQALAAVQDAGIPNGDAGLLAGTFDSPGVDVAFDDFIVIKP